MSEPVEAVHTKTFRLHSYEVDRNGKARPDILLSFMLDSAWSHTKDTEFSYDELNEEGHLWVLSRFLAVFHEMPQWDDEITVETWGKGTDRLFGLRDFVVYSKSRRKLLSATSAWLIVDRKTMRVQRIDSLKRNFPVQSGRQELDSKLEKIEQEDAVRTGLELKVRYSDLDVNKHVNSSKYMQWILDSFPADYPESKGLETFEINFLSEAVLGDRVIVSSGGTESRNYCDVRREEDGTELCRAIVKWK